MRNIVTFILIAYLTTMSGASVLAVEKSITVTAPVGARWQRGDRGKVITWRAQGLAASERVSITLIVEGYVPDPNNFMSSFDSVYTIDEATNSGSFVWNLVAQALPLPGGFNNARIMPNGAYEVHVCGRDRVCGKQGRLTIIERTDGQPFTQESEDAVANARAREETVNKAAPNISISPSAEQGVVFTVVDTVKRVGRAIRRVFSFGKKKENLQPATPGLDKIKPPLPARPAEGEASPVGEPRETRPPAVKPAPRKVMPIAPPAVDRVPTPALAPAPVVSPPPVVPTVVEQVQPPAAPPAPASPPTSEADLTIANNTVSISPVALKSGTAVRFETTITNRGNAATGVFVSENVSKAGIGDGDAYLRIDLGSDGQWDVLLKAYVGALAPSKTSFKVFRWTAVAGTHAYQLCADGANKVLERDENNNCVSGTLTVAE